VAPHGLRSHGVKQDIGEKVTEGRGGIPLDVFSPVVNSTGRDPREVGGGSFHSIPKGNQGMVEKKKKKGTS